MKRLKDDFLEIINKKVSLKDKDILEIGCGNGSRSKPLAEKCKTLTAIDPDKDAILDAQKNNSAKNIHYLVGKAEDLAFKDDLFDVVVFTLSLHHVPTDKMYEAIGEAIRVLKKGGKIIFFEPYFSGTFFDAELQFDASDGDERKEKAYAYYAMLNDTRLKEIEEVYDETILKFDTYNDFIQTMQPKKNISRIKNFLEKNAFTLIATRRINIFSVNN